MSLLLRAAQRAWITFRDAEATRIADAEGRGGSICPMISAITHKRLTRNASINCEEVNKSELSYEAL